MLIQTTMWIHLKKILFSPYLENMERKRQIIADLVGGSFNKQRALHIRFVLFGNNTKQISQTTHQNFKSLCRSLNEVQLCILSAGMLSCFSHVQLFVTLWTVAHQVPLSMEFSRQEYQSGQPFPSPGYLPEPRIERWNSCFVVKILYHLSHQGSPREVKEWKKMRQKLECKEGVQTNKIYGGCGRIKLKGRILL